MTKKENGNKKVNQDKGKKSTHILEKKITQCPALSTDRAECEFGIGLRQCFTETPSSAQTTQ